MPNLCFFWGGEFFSKFWSDLDELWLTHPPQVTVSSWARQSLAPQICSAKGIDPVLKMLISSFIFVWCLKIYLSVHASLEFNKLAMNENSSLDVPSFINRNYTQSSIFICVFRTFIDVVHVLQYIYVIHIVSYIYIL